MAVEKAISRSQRVRPTANALRKFARPMARVNLCGELMYNSLSNNRQLSC